MIALIDDEEDIVDVYCGILASENLPVVGFVDIEGANRAGESFLFSTLIIDHGVFRKSKEKVLRFIASNQIERILMFTGDFSITKENDDLAKICESVIYKPMKIDDFTSEVLRIYKGVR